MDLRKTLDSVVGTARWAASNPGALVDLAKNVVRRDDADSFTEPAAPGTERPTPEGLSSYQRQVTVSARSERSASAVRGLVGDLSLLPQWMTIHAGWRGQPPAVAVAGAEVAEQVKIMGVPAEIRWRVVTASEDQIGLTGTGPMGLTMGLWFSVIADRDGSVVWIDAGMGGDPLRGPMGGTIARTVRDEMERSLAALVALADNGVEGAAAPSHGPVLHEATGRKLAPQTPIIVGVGQVTQATPDLSREPADLAAEAVRRAATDAGAPGLLTAADGIFAVASTSWTYQDLAASVATRIGAQPKETVQSARFGGDSGQLLINAAGQAIADGTADVIVVCGAEAGNSFAAAQKQGTALSWEEQSSAVRPTRVLGSEKEANNEAESRAGLMAPIYVYGLLETALRARLGRTRTAHQEAITGLWSRFSQVAAENPHAWQPEGFSAERLATSDADNRMISSPYSKLLCANLQVDQASGIIVTNVATAQAMGIAQEKWVFLHAGAAAHDEWFVSERGDLAASPAINAIGKAALTQAGVTIDEVRHVDLYSCFPVAVQIAARELGLPLDDADRPLSLTGGLTFGGGPGNNYGGHAVATLVDRLRANPGEVGLSTSLGWYLTKHAIGIYSTTPPSRPYRSLAPLPEPVASRRALTDVAGDAVVEAYTVQYGRDGAPQAVIVSGIQPSGDRVLLRSTVDDVVARFVDDDPLGWALKVTDVAEFAIVDDTAHEVPPAPAMPVLLDRRGPLWVITLNRPHRRNAIDHPTAQLLERIIDSYEADDEARVAILTGAGGTFSAGMDLKAAAAGQFPLTERRGPLGITSAPISKPLIAAVEGHALAGGCELALVADLVVASTESQFGLPEAKRGLVAAAGGVMRMAQRLPRNVAMELALTGNPMPAERMAELGLVNRLAAPGTVLEAAIALADEVMANAPLSLAISKRIIEAAPDWSADEGFALQSEMAGAALFSEDAAEGVVAFAEGRAPVWKGR
ncbi:crotonase/enoyl-CoA hydratase family protein [Nocardioides sp. Bht2]|uniref:type II toxin-antitoxin system Rv0910 family toxin n=1 Tax=Nocardioides sp. Bht2 TaxID=3392297 RepID=UPI0039B46621